jgi:uncharacterized protein (TIGR02266 family)
MPDKKNILVICGTSVGQLYLGVLLNRFWYSPVLARTVDDGVLLARKTPFSLILVDGDGPHEELRIALDLMKTEPSFKGRPLVVVMTDDDSARSEALISRGCSAVFTKPLDLAIVYGVLARLSGQPRNAPRVSIKTRVEIAEKVPEKFLMSVNISEGGIYLRTAAPPQEGTILHIRFTLPHDNELTEAAGEVIRTLPLGPEFEEEPGMALRFIDVPRNTLLRIRNFVQWEMTRDLEWKSTI